MKNKKLHYAKKHKNDEFYTQLVDIEKELIHYKEQLENKVIYCNCDSPLRSNFYKYFVDNFEELKIKKVISACYQENNKGFYYEYNGKNKKYPTMEDVVFFEGSGDFRSEESLKLLKTSDIVITNPPFSLLKDYIPKLIEYNKDFLIIAGISTISIKNIFELIKENKIWLGMNFGREVSGFIVPEEYELYGSETKINEKNERIISPNNCLWLTNLQNKKREQIFELKENYEENKYAFYDNFPAINVNKTKDIPIGYNGIIGVPITFLNKFNPDQFEIVGFRKGLDGKDLRINGKSLFCRILIKIRY